MKLRWDERKKKWVKKPRVVVPDEKLQLGTGFKAMWFRDIDTYPIYVTSKRQLREECDKRETEFGKPVACQLL